MQEQSPVQLDYEIRQQSTWWTYLRFALIGWSVLGILRFLGAWITPGTLGRSVLMLPQLADLFASTCFLVGAIAARSLNSRNTGLSIGAGALLIYALLATWFGNASLGGRSAWLGGIPRGALYLSLFLGAIEHIWFPLAVVGVKVRLSGPLVEGSVGGSLGTPLHLLLAAQTPGLVGVALLIALLAGIIKSDPFGAMVGIILILTIAASLISAGLSFAFVRSSHRKLAIWMGIGHLTYLIALVTICAIMIATSKPRYHGPGGF